MRNLILKDAHDLYEIRKASFESFWSEKEFVSMLSDESFFGFREDRGFILCRRALNYIDIVTFCVDPKYRRQGIGKKLLTGVVKFAQRNSCETFLEVAEKNVAARNLYVSFGFKEISVRKNYYKFKGKTQNALVMKHTP